MEYLYSVQNIEEYLTAYTKYRDVLSEYKKGKDLYEKGYLNVKGEKESRNVEKRRELRDYETYPMNTEFSIESNHIKGLNELKDFNDINKFVYDKAVNRQNDKTMLRRVLKVIDGGAPLLDEDVITVFKELGSSQRGKPEQAMLQVQKNMGGGVLNPVVEHLGHLTHRMTHMAEYDNALRGTMKEKVDRGLRYLKSEYGFDKEFKENIKSTAQHRGISEKEFVMRKLIEDAIKAQENDRGSDSPGTR